MENVTYKIITFILVIEIHHEYHSHYWCNNMNRTVPENLHLNKLDNLSAMNKLLDYSNK